MNEDERMKRFEERMEKAKAREAEREKEQAENLRVEYLKRTGRTEMKA